MQKLLIVVALVNAFVSADVSHILQPQTADGAYIYEIPKIQLCANGKVGPPCEESTNQNREYLPPKCPDGYTGIYPKCVPPPSPTPPPRCPSGYSGVYPDCRRPTTPAPRCAPGLLGEYPNCYAPTTTPAPRCPAGTFGQYPDCRRPTTTPAPRCPSGYTGVCIQIITHQLRLKHLDVLLVN